MEKVHGETRIHEEKLNTLSQSDVIDNEELRRREDRARPLLSGTLIPPFCARRRGKRKKDIHSRLGLEAASRHRHASERRSVSTEQIEVESMHVNGAPECMRISGFMHGITNPDLIKRLNDNIPKSVDEMMKVTTAFLRGEVAAANQSRKKAPPAWKHHESGLRKIQAVPSTAHGMLKFPIEGEIVTLHSNTVRPAKCRMVVEALSRPSPN
nr:reverse transcriptase domain-containing protein [Tanacetum cinerariifolium]